MENTEMARQIGAYWFLIPLMVILGCQGTGAWLTSSEGEMGPAVENGIVVEPWGQIDGTAVPRAAFRSNIRRQWAHAGSTDRLRSHRDRMPCAGKSRYIDRHRSRL